MYLLDGGQQITVNRSYGATSPLMSGSNPTPYGYKGQWGYYTDAESGILLLTHRYLDPATGRFLTRDPIGIEGGVNLYAYCRNRVVMLNDRSGTIGIFPIVCSACAVCLAGFALSCYDCGLDVSCWKNCVSNIWQNLPTWVKILCGGACIWCGAHIILPGTGNPDPSPEPDCPDPKPGGPNPGRSREECERECAYVCEHYLKLPQDPFWWRFHQCMDSCVWHCMTFGIPSDPSRN